MSDGSGKMTSTERADHGSMAEDGRGEERAPNTFLNAIIGGVVGVVLSFIPFSTILGGAVAGYLEGGDSTAGAKVGALAGLVALVPFVLVVGVLLFFVPVMVGSRFGFLVSVLVVLLLAAFYTVVLSAVGGVLGIYIKENV